MLGNGPEKQLVYAIDIMVNDLASARTEQSANYPSWKDVVVRYQKSEVWSGVWQVVNTLVPYAALWCLMYATLQVSWWLTLPLAVLAGGFLVRLFIISHDCGHGSFLPSRQANDILGFITGVLTFVPYHHWRWEHALHHATSGDLDRRGTGDVWTLTVQEYLEASRWKRFSYRLARNPAVLFGLAPLFLFLIKMRFPSAKAPRRERHSVAWTNLAIVALAAGMSGVFGLQTYLLLQVFVMLVAGTAGVWLFYVQHQFEGVYWERGAGWDYATAALKGSSFYKLPKVLQWFSGNIGFHHIHHLSPRIPNYHLEQCHRAEPLFQTVKPVTLCGSLKSLTFRLWDERHHRLVGYRALRGIQKQQQSVL
ncbi:MAG: fatty acid desaturase [Verrucomicrobiota bacterium]|jgi:omega-6 fatty acid desaturase (delta-12 desaturase)